MHFSGGSAGFADAMATGHASGGGTGAVPDPAAATAAGQLCRRTPSLRFPLQLLPPSHHC